MIAHRLPRVPTLAGERPYRRVRDALLTTVAGALATNSGLLWNIEALVLSARYQQWIAHSPWGRHSIRQRDRISLWRAVARRGLLTSGTVALEFGIADGVATRWWSRSGVAFAAWHGFDTFEGLPTDWYRAGTPVMSAGTFTPSAGPHAVPMVEAPFPYEWHAGMIEERLPDFVRPDAPLFILIDVDLFEPARAILEWLKANWRSGDLVYFDEAFDPWNEGLALRRAIDAGMRLSAIAHTGMALLTQLLAVEATHEGTAQTGKHSEHRR
jgi:hypothetical protein